MFERVAALGSREFETGLNLAPGAASNAGESPNRATGEPGCPSFWLHFSWASKKK